MSAYATSYINIDASGHGKEHPFATSYINIVASSTQGAIGKCFINIDASLTNVHTNVYLNIYTSGVATPAFGKMQSFSILQPIHKLTYGRFRLIQKIVKVNHTTVIKRQNT